FDLLIGESPPVSAGRGRTLEKRVIDIGDVLYVPDFATRVAPCTVEEVERDVGGRVANVGGVVWRNAADVEARRAVWSRDLPSAGSGVENGNGGTRAKLRKCRERRVLPG